MSVNPFQTMRARYFLIVFALLTVVARASNELIENTFHMQNSTFINILIFYILPITWIFFEYKKHRVAFSLFINRNETFNLMQVLYITIMLCVFSYGYLILYMYSFAWITPTFIMNALREPIMDSTGGICLSSYYGRIHRTNYWGICFSRIFTATLRSKMGNEYSDHCCSNIVCIVTR